MLTSGISNPAGMGSSTKTLKNNVNIAINVTGLPSRTAFREWAGCTPSPRTFTCLSCLGRTY